MVSTLAGTAGVIGSVDGSGAAARFYNPNGIAADTAGNLYVADTNNSTIRKITAAGVVSTLAGTAGVIGSADGSGAAAQFNSPYGIAVDTAGNLYVADLSNSTIRKITQSSVSTIGPPASCALTANPPTVPIEGGPVSLVMSCASGGIPTSFRWNGGFANRLTTTTNTVEGTVTKNTNFTVIASNASGNSIPASIIVTLDRRALQIISISPDRGPTGTDVTIGGIAFGATQGQSTIRFGNVIATDISRWGNNHIRVRAPTVSASASNIVVPITITVNNKTSVRNCGTANSANPDCTFTYPPVKQITFFIPPEGVEQSFRTKNPLHTLFLNVAKDEMVNFGTGHIGRDECYFSTMRVVANLQQSELLNAGMKQLSWALVNTSLGLVSTGSVLWDFMFNLSRATVGSIVLDAPLSDALLTTVAESTAGYIIGQKVAEAVNPLLAPAMSSLGSITAGIVTPQLRTLLNAVENNTNGVLFWGFSGNSATTIRLNLQDANAPFATVNAKVAYNPWNYFTTATIATKCQSPGQNAPKLHVYTITYKVKKTSFGFGDNAQLDSVVNLHVVQP